LVFWQTDFLAENCLLSAGGHWASLADGQWPMPRADSMKILIIGCNGQVGWELQRTLAPLGAVTAIDFPDIDLTSADNVTAVLRSVSPDLIVNAAAYTAVDRAEQEPALAEKINADAPALLARQARELDAALIHYSTDYVFDGTKQGAYIETDTPNPQNVYGKTKLAGEMAIEAAGTRNIVLRTSWVYSDRSSNFLLTMLRLASEREQLRVVADQHGTPTWSRTLARTTARIVAQELSHGTKKLFGDTSGVYHATGADVTTWHGFTQAILEEYSRVNGARQPLKAREVLPITTDEYPVPAKRPRNSVLSNDKLAQVFRIEPRPWREQLRELMAEMFTSK
jgi:dTDP-4-dehydrorhamnose reductase